MSHRTLSHALAATLVVLGLAACSDSPAGPGGTTTGTPLLSQDITLGQLSETLDGGPARVEIKLVPGSLEAREIELKTGDEMDDRESIRAHVTAISSSASSLTVEIGGITISFDGSTRFRGEDGDLTRDAFVAQVESILASGTEPFVRAKRAAPAEPQAPGDGTFLASELRLREHGNDSPKIEINVDADNFALNDAPPPLATLTVLGVGIQITSNTDLEDDVNENEETEFEGLVASVDVAAGSLTLEDGTVVLVVDETRIEQDDDGEKLGSLQDVADALAAGTPVKAEGHGSLESTSPRTILARELELQTRNGDEDEDDNGDDGQAQGAEFRGAVASADVGAMSVTLAGGAVIVLTDATVIEAEGDLTSLQAVADAIAAGKAVRAEGRGTVTDAGPPAIFEAATIKFEVDED